MFRAGNHPILADEMEVLMELRDQLALNGIDRFRSMKRTQDHIQCTCPFHKDGQERRPSCGITTNDIRQGDKLVRAGTVHCLACGYTGTLEETISRLFGYNDLGVFGTAWLKKNFLTVQYEERDSLDLDLSRGRKTGSDTIKYVSEEELDSYRYIHPYMYQRKLTDDVIEMFDVGYDDCFVLQSQDGKETMYKCVTFPVRDITGGTLFIARRSVDTKFFNYPAGVEKPVYGIYELSQIKPYPTEVIICESIFNCLTCYAYGKYALALNGTGTIGQYEQLKKLPVRKYILGLDPDDAGNRGRAKLRKYLGDSKIITEYVIPEGKDINDLTKEEFDALEEVV
jgi:hypothetical protein